MSSVRDGTVMARLRRLDVCKYGRCVSQSHWCYGNDFSRRVTMVLSLIELIAALPMEAANSTIY
jgi:hypothetical protein